MDIKSILRNGARQIKTRGIGTTFRSLVRRAQVRWYERHYGIRTDAVIDLAELGIHNKDCRYYSATDYGEFHHIMRAIAIDPREHVFLDYGAGMGRAMILAATFPFRRVLGVEISPDLTKIANENIKGCRKILLCKNIEITTCDAGFYEIPPDVTVFYFFNPFCGAVLAGVLKNIRAFAKTSSRPVLLVCNVPLVSAFEDEILKQGWLEKKDSVSLPADRHCLIFLGAPSGPSAAPN